MTQEVFLLSYTKYGDHDAVLHCFCRENGFASFFAKGIYAPKNKKKAFRSLKNRDGLSIEERPKDVERRDAYGHWEMDIVVSGKGDGRGVLLVLTERYSREEKIIKLPNRKQESVIKAIDKLEIKYGQNKFREKFITITTDNGVEFEEMSKRII